MTIDLTPYITFAIGYGSATLISILVYRWLKRRDREWVKDKVKKE